MSTIKKIQIPTGEVYDFDTGSALSASLFGEEETGEYPSKAYSANDYAVINGRIYHFIHSGSISRTWAQHIARGDIEDVTESIFSFVSTYAEPKKLNAQTQSNAVLWRQYGNIVVVLFNGYTVTASGDVTNFVPENIGMPAANSRGILINATNTKLCSILAKSSSRTFNFDPQEANKPYYGSLVYYCND